MLLTNVLHFLKICRELTYFFTLIVFLICSRVAGDGFLVEGVNGAFVTAHAIKRWYLGVAMLVKFCFCCCWGQKPLDVSQTGRYENVFNVSLEGDKLHRSRSVLLSAAPDDNMWLGFSLQRRKREYFLQSKKFKVSALPNGSS